MRSTRLSTFDNAPSMMAMCSPRMRGRCSAINILILFELIGRLRRCGRKARLDMPDDPYFEKCSIYGSVVRRRVRQRARLCFLSGCVCASVRLWARIKVWP